MKLLTVALAAFLLSAPARADETEQRVRFAEPVRIKAGSKFLGENRLYPSPVLHDVDGDKKIDVIVADLVGRVTVAHRAGAAPVFKQEQPLLDSKGEQLSFHNW